MRKIHELKTWPEPFREVDAGRKRYEIRVNDRGFDVNDFLWLREYNPCTDTYSGDSVVVEVTYMTRGGQWGLPDELCVMSIVRLPESSADLVMRQHDLFQDYAD